MTLSGAPHRVPAGPVAPRARLADPRRRCRQLDLPVRFIDPFGRIRQTHGQSGATQSVRAGGKRPGDGVRAARRCAHGHPRADPAARRRPRCGPRECRAATACVRRPGRPRALPGIRQDTERGGGAHRVRALRAARGSCLAVDRLRSRRRDHATFPDRRRRIAGTGLAPAPEQRRRARLPARVRQCSGSRLRDLPPGRHWRLPTV